MDNSDNFEENNFKFEAPQEKFRYSDSNGFRFSNDSNMKFNMDDCDSNYSFVFENFKNNNENQNHDSKNEGFFPIKNCNLDDSLKEGFTEYNRENLNSNRNYNIPFDNLKHNEKSLNKSSSLEITCKLKRLNLESNNETSIEYIIDILLTFQNYLIESKMQEIFKIITNISKLNIKNNISPSYIRFLREMIFISDIIAEAQIILNIINNNDFNIDNFINDLKLSYKFFHISIALNFSLNTKISSNLNDYLNPVNLIILSELNEKRKIKFDSMHLCSIDFEIFKKISNFRKILSEKLFIERIYFEFIKKILFYIQIIKDSFDVELLSNKTKSNSNNNHIINFNSKNDKILNEKDPICNEENYIEIVNLSSNEYRKELKFYLSNFKFEVIFAILSYLQENSISNFESFLKYYYCKFNLFKSNVINSYTTFFDHFYQINIADFNNKLVLKNQYSVIKEKIRIDKSFLNTQKISFRQKKRNIIQFNKYQDFLKIENVDLVLLFNDFTNFENGKISLLNQTQSQENDLNLTNIKDSKIDRVEASNFIDNSDLIRFSINSLKSDFFTFKIKSKESNTTIKKKQNENAFFENFNNLSINDDLAHQSYLDFQMKNDNSILSKNYSGYLSILKNPNLNDVGKEYKIDSINPDIVKLRFKRKNLNNNILDSCINDTLNTNTGKNNSRLINSKIIGSSSLISDKKKRYNTRKTRNHQKNPNLNKLKEFNFEFAKRENIDKKIIRKFRKYVQDKYFKNLKLTRKKSQFYDLMNQFLNKCLFPPCKTYDNLIFKSFSYSYLSWLFSHRILQLLFKKYIKSSLQTLANYLCEIFAVESSEEIDKLKNYLENYIEIYSLVQHNTSININNNLILNSSRSKYEISEINQSILKNDAFESELDYDLNIFDESAEIRNLLNKYTNNC